MDKTDECIDGDEYSSPAHDAAVALVRGRNLRETLRATVGRDGAEALLDARRMRALQCVDTDELATRVGRIMAALGVPAGSCDALQVVACIEAGRVVRFGQCQSGCETCSVRPHTPV